MTYESPPPPPPPQTAATDRLATIRTYMLIAFIFSIIFMIGWVLAALGTIASLAFAFAFGVAAFVIIPALIYLVWFVVSIIVFMRVYKMYKAANAGDIATLKAYSNIVWAIIALIFTIVPGIMLLIADGPIKQL